MILNMLQLVTALIISSILVLVTPCQKYFTTTMQLYLQVNSSKLFFYKFFNFFVKPTKKYLFNEEVKQLNNYLSQQQFYLFILVITNLLYFVITLGGPYLFTYKLLDKDPSHVSKPYLCVNWSSSKASYLYYYYYVFAVFSFIIEEILYCKVAQIVPNHEERIIVKKIESDEEQDDHNQLQIAEQILEKQNKKILLATQEGAVMLKKKQQTQQTQISKKQCSYRFQ